MLFRQLFDQTSSTYTYLLADSDSREAVIIDPVKEQLETYLRLIRELDLKLVAAVDTHTHADHITALGDLRDASGCTTYLGQGTLVECVSTTVADGGKIPFGRYALKAIATPGHTDDSYSFYLDSQDMRAVFSGDTLLIRGTGRTDFQQGDAGDQYRSLFDKLLQLPEDTLVYPGHDYKGWTVSSIGEEKRYNPRLQVSNADEYRAIMDNLNLPDPRLMDIAIPANLSCGQQ